MSGFLAKTSVLSMSLPSQLPPSSQPLPSSLLWPAVPPLPISARPSARTPSTRAVLQGSQLYPNLISLPIRTILADTDRLIDLIFGTRQRSTNRNWSFELSRVCVIISNGCDTDANRSHEEDSRRRYTDQILYVSPIE